MTGLTRSGSSSQLPDGVKAVSIDYNDEESIIAALKGQDFLIITLSLSAAPDTHNKIVRAAARAGVSYVMPNAYGIDFFGKEGLRADIPVGQAILERTSDVERQGLTWIGLTVGFWYEYSLRNGEDLFGFDLKNRKLVLYDDGRTLIDTSTWPLCGQAVAALLSLKIFPHDENDTSVTLSQFFNKSVYISSFKISQLDMFESVKRVTDTRDEDWQLSHQLTKERYKEATKELEQGHQMAFYKAMYSRVFYPTGDGEFEAHNSILKLPKEDLDAATKAALEI